MRFKLSQLNLVKTITGFARYLWILLVIGAISALAILSIFLYNNLYLTVTQSKEIILLKQEVAPDTIDIIKVDKILEKINKKTNKPENANLNNLRNPFDFTSATVETQTTITPEAVAAE